MEEFKILQHGYKYKLLQDNPKICKRLFGIKFELLETILVKVQNHKDSFSQENPTSNRGLDGEFSVSNQLLLTLEYLILTCSSIYLLNLYKKGALFWAPVNFFSRRSRTFNSNIFF